MKYILLLLTFFSLSSWADTPPARSIFSFTYDGTGTKAITGTVSGGKTGLDVNVINSGGTSTVNQGTAGISSWLVSITNVPHMIIDSMPAVTISGSVAVTGPLTDTQLRASAVPISAASLPLPAGAATAANQTTANASLSSIDSKLTSPLAVTGTFFQATQPVSIAATVAVSGPLTDTQLRASAVPVSLASNQSINLNQIVGAAPSVTNYLPARISNGTTYVDPTQIRALSSGTDSVSAVGSGNFTVVQPTGTNLHTVVDSGSLTANIGTTNGLALDATVATVQGSANGGSAAAKSNLSGGIYNSSPPTLTNGQQASLQLDSSGNLKTSGTSTVSGTITANQGTSPWVTSASQSGTWTVQQGTPPWSVSQSGSWTTGRTWSLSSGSDSVAAVQSGTWNLNNISGTISLPTGASTAANQTSGNSSLSSIDGKIPSGLTVTATRLLVDGSGVTQPISAASLPLPTGASTSALQTTGNSSLSSIDGKLNSLGQKTMAASVPVVIASDQTAVPASQSGSWTVTANAGTNLNTSALATSANQTNASQKTQIVDGSGNVVGPVTTLSAVNYIPVIQASTGTTGAAVPARTTQVGGSDGTNLVTLKVKSTGALVVDRVGSTAGQLVRNVYSTTNVTTAAYVQLIASTTNETNHIFIFDSSGQTLFLATGAAASEVNRYYIVPGGNELIDLNIPAGTRISVKAVSATASAGELSMTLMQ